MTTSGGGYRSLLTGAGVIQGLDGRDSNVSTSGLFQALTYHAGLSGGAWLLSSLAGNNYPTVSSLKTSLWEDAFKNSLLFPNGIYFLLSDAYITSDVVSKEGAGFDTTLIDPWGRLLSYQLLKGTNGGVSTTLSSVASLSNFTSYAVPFPIITSLGVKTFNGECGPGPNATTYEFNPFEFGSWDSDVSAFTQTAYLGSNLTNGVPVGTTSCVKNYDNLGYVLGTSSNTFNELCAAIPVDGSIQSDLEEVLQAAHDFTSKDVYAVYKNPFYKYSSPSGQANPANLISAQAELNLIDGGESLQNNPIFPLLQPARGIDVILVNDNSADTSDNFPNGTEILTTYVQSLNHNLTRMPFIPSVDTFISQGLNKRATFFGCDAADKITIVWIPNVNYTYASGVSTAKLQYEKAETNGMIANGLQVSVQGGESGWATCLGCAVMQKTGGTLPGDCEACFEKHCYYGT